MEEIKQLESNYFKNPTLSNFNALNNKRFKLEKELNRNIKIKKKRVRI